MSDTFPADSVTSSARRTVAVTPSDSTDLLEIAKALYVGSSGSIVIRAADDAGSTALQVLAGAVLPIRVRRVFATGTTATGIVALY